MLQAIAHGGELANRLVELFRLGREYLPVDREAPVRREHRGDVVQRKPGGAAKRDQRQALEHERAAAPFLPALPARRVDEPGQFAFADPARVHTILTKSGWAKIDIQPVDVECALPESELVPYLSKLGPVGRVLEGVDARARALAIDKIRAAFDPYVHGTEVRFTAACWVVSAVVTGAAGGRLPSAAP
jgi:hypothetical protein